MENERLSARELTRASRMSLGKNVRLRGEAANLVAIGILVFAALTGSSLVVVASGIVTALAKRRLPADHSERREAIASMRSTSPSLPRA